MAHDEPHETYAAHRPHVGDPVTYQGNMDVASVTSVEKSLCWYTYPGQEKPSLFIWCFRDRLNTLHDWPAKSAPRT